MFQVLFLLSFFIQSSFGYNWYVYSRDSHWVKRISPDISAGGLVTSRQIEELADGGFKTVISIAYEAHTIDEFNGITGPFPSSMEEIKIANEFGMQAVNYNVSYTASSLYSLSTDILHMPKPIFIHCHAGYAASLFAIMHEYLAGVVDSADIFQVGLTLGWDFQADASAVEFVNSITKTQTAVAAPSIEQNLADGENSYKYYYWSHRVGNDGWYNIGQVLSTQVRSIADSGYKSVICFRSDGEATTRVGTDPVEGPVNNDEFSDENGNFDLHAEQAAFEAVGLKFYNLPVGGEGSWTLEQLDAYTPAMDEASSLGPVLAHCASGYRSSAYTIAYLARQQNQCTHWALKEARRIGYSFDQSEDDAQVVAFFEEVLKC